MQPALGPMEGLAAVPPAAKEADDHRMKNVNKRSRFVFGCTFPQGLQQGGKSSWHEYTLSIRL
eukprot:1158700-Pelagomonas_calceolata.AAC.5